MKKYLFSSVILVCLFLQTRAQDIHFSQYNMSPLTLNPALTGLSECDARVNVNFRSQWNTVSPNAYRTEAISGDFALNRLTKYTSFAGLGLSVFADQAGDLNLLTNKVELSFAYHFMLNRRGTSQISAGIQAGFTHRGIDFSKATFDSQYDALTGRPDFTAKGESLGRTNVFYGDAGLGLMYSMMIRQTNNLYFGISLTHVNQPRKTFQPSHVELANSTDRLYMKFTFHGGGLFGVSPLIGIQPSFMFLLQGPSKELDAGVNVRIKLHRTPVERTYLTFGLQYRGFYDAMIIQGRVDIKEYTIGLSYDVNVSKLLPASSSFGGPELAFVYQGCFNKKPKPGHCPAL